MVMPPAAHFRVDRDQILQQFKGQSRRPDTSQIAFDLEVARQRAIAEDNMKDKLELQALKRQMRFRNDAGAEDGPLDVTVNTPTASGRRGRRTGSGESKQNNNLSPGGAARGSSSARVGSPAVARLAGVPKLEIPKQSLTARLFSFRSASKKDGRGGSTPAAGTQGAGTPISTRRSRFTDTPMASSWLQSQRHSVRNAILTNTSTKPLPAVDFEDSPLQLMSRCVTASARCLWRCGATVVQNTLARFPCAEYVIPCVGRRWPWAGGCRRPRGRTRRG